MCVHQCVCIVKERNGATAWGWRVEPKPVPLLKESSISGYILLFGNSVSRGWILDGKVEGSVYQNLGIYPKPWLVGAQAVRLLGAGLCTGTKCPTCLLRPSITDWIPRPTIWFGALESIRKLSLPKISTASTGFEFVTNVLFSIEGHLLINVQ